MQTAAASDPQKEQVSGVELCLLCDVVETIELLFVVLRLVNPFALPRAVASGLLLLILPGFEYYSLPLRSVLFTIWKLACVDTVLWTGFCYFCIETQVA